MTLCIFLIHPYVWILTLCGVILTVLYIETDIFASNEGVSCDACDGGALAAFVLFWALIAVVLVKLSCDICDSDGAIEETLSVPDAQVADI